MSKIKMVFYFIIVVALAVIVAENHIFFSTPQALNINLKYKFYTLPAIPNGLYMLGSFIIGCLFFYVKSLMLRFQTKKTVKYLNARMKVQLDELSSLRKEIEFLHRNKTRTIHVSKSDNETVNEAAPETIQKTTQTVEQG